MAVDTVTSSFSVIFQETLFPTVQYYTYELSPIVGSIVVSNKGVYRPADNMGRDWKVRKIFRTGLGGAFEYEQMGAASLMTDDSVTNFQAYGNDAVSVWPGLDETTTPGYSQMVIGLVQGKGNMHVPLALKRAAQEGSVIGDAVQAVVESTAERTALTQINAFLVEATDGVVGTFTITGGSVSNTGTSISLDSGQSSVRRFRDGLAIDIFRTSAGTQLNTAGPVFIDQVDTLATSSHMKLYSFAGTVNFDAAATQYDLVVRNSGRTNASATMPNLPTALTEIIVSSSTDLYGLSTSKHPMLKSHVASLGGAALDEITLIKHAATYEHARSGLWSLDTFCFSEGVGAAYVDALDGMYTYERQGAPLDINAGFKNDLMFNAYGRTYRLKTDPFLPAGTVYGLRMRNNNFKKYMPVRLRGVGNNQAFTGGVEFIGPLLGWNGIFGSAKKTGGTNRDGSTTDFLEAPFLMPYEICPDVIPGMKLTSVKESYGS